MNPIIANVRPTLVQVTPSEGVTRNYQNYSNYSGPSHSINIGLTYSSDGLSSLKIGENHFKDRTSHSNNGSFYFNDGQSHFNLGLTYFSNYSSRPILIKSTLKTDQIILLNK